jgi:hypothetical protein
MPRRQPRARPVAEPTREDPGRQAAPRAATEEEGAKAGSHAAHHRGRSVALTQADDDDVGDAETEVGREEREGDHAQCKHPWPVGKSDCGRPEQERGLGDEVDTPDQVSPVEPSRDCGADQPSRGCGSEYRADHRWAQVPAGLDEVAIADEARTRKVSLNSGQLYFPAEPEGSYVRVGFAAAADEAELLKVLAASSGRPAIFEGLPPGSVDTRGQQGFRAASAAVQILPNSTGVRPPRAPCPRRRLNLVSIQVTSTSRSCSRLSLRRLSSTCFCSREKRESMAP